MYRVASEVPHDFELRDAVVAPGEDYHEGEILRGRDGYIEVNVGSDGCLVSQWAGGNLRRRLIVLCNTGC